MTVRVSVLSLFGSVVTTHAALPEVQLLLQQPMASNGGSGSSQDNWRQRDGVSSPSRTPTAHSRSNDSHANSPHVAHTPAEEGGAGTWLLPMCVGLVTQPREDQSGSEGSGTNGGVALEQLPIRVQALQVSGYDETEEECKQQNVAPHRLNLIKINNQCRPTRTEMEVSGSPTF